MSNTVEAAEVDRQTLLKHRSFRRDWIFIEEVLDVLGLRPTAKNRNKAAVMLGILGWEHVPLRTLSGDYQPNRDRGDPPAPTSKPADKESLWVRTQSLWEIQERGADNPIVELLVAYARGVPIDAPSQERRVQKPARSGEYKPKQWKDPVLVTLRQHDEGYMTAKQIAEKLASSEKRIRARLRKLERDDFVGTLRVGNATVYFERDM